MAGNGGLYCLGCGENLVGKKPFERRVLQGKKVTNVHRHCQCCCKTLNLCRSCFEKYKTLAKLRCELVEKAERALAKMNAVPNTSRRKRNCTALEQPTSKRLFVEDEQTSPAVVVSATL